VGVVVFVVIVVVGGVGVDSTTTNLFDLPRQHPGVPFVFCMVGSSSEVATLHASTGLGER
jgi:hypothetical protein